VKTALQQIINRITRIRRDSMLRFVALACLLVVATCAPVFVEDEPEENHSLENAGAYQGDMVLTPEQMNAVMEGTFSYGSATYGRWPGAKVPYFIDRSMPSAGRRAIEAAIADYHRYTCIRFTPYQRGNRNYIKFYNGQGCHSPVGMSSRGNSVSLGSGCHSKGTAEHEIAHSLGFFHEQSRPDRDRYVRIHTQNLQQPNMAFNFQIQRGINSMGTPYDLASMMHYSSTAFAKRGTRTITTIDRSKQRMIDTYNRISGFSQTDIKQLNLMYCNGRGK